MEDNIRFLKPYLRGLPIIIVAMIIGVLAAKKYLGYATPMYESTAKLRLADKAEGTPGSNLFKDLDVFASSNKIAAEIEILKSQVLMNKVLDVIDFDVEVYRVGKIRTVELYQNSPLVIKYSRLKENAYDREYELVVNSRADYEISIPKSGKKLKGYIGMPLETEFGNFLIMLNDSVLKENEQMPVADNYKFVINSKQKLYEKISKNLDIISADKDVAVIRISYKSPNPIKASKLVNKLAEVYIQDYIDTKFKAASITVDFLDDQISKVIERVVSSENGIQSYRDNNSITNITQETETDLRKVSQLKIQQTNLKMTLEAVQQLDNYITSGKDHFLDLAPNFEAFTDLLSTEIMKNIKTLQSEKKDLLLQYTSENEKVKVIDAKIADLTAYLAESIKNTRRDLESKYNNLSADITEAEKVFIGVPEKEKMLNILNREFNIYQHSYNFLNEKKIEAEIAQSAKIALHRIISPGVIAKEPVSPNRTIITLISAILGMLGSVLLIFIVHTLKAKVNDLQNIETNSSIPVAVLTPKLKNEEEIKKHFLREAIQLEIKGLVKSKSIVCFTAYKNEEGSIFNAAYLAAAFASQNRKVLLLDIDHGISENHSISKEIISTFEVRALSSIATISYTQSKMMEVMNELKQEFDLIIILNEALEKDTKSKLLMSVADLNLVVFDSRLTPGKKIQQTDMMQAEYNFPAMHILLNRFAYNPSVITEFMKYAKMAYMLVFKKVRFNKLKHSA